LIESNQKFHLQIARMSHNGEFENILRGVLERSIRLIYLAASGSKQVPKDIETLLRPVVDAIRARDAKAAHRAVTTDIAHGQLNALGRDFWGETSRRYAAGLVENEKSMRKPRKTVAASSAPRKDSADSSTDSGRASAPFARTRKGS
jgi:hypothetical protein